MAETLKELKAALADSYVIERKLGEGGMATVYLAEDVKHRRKVAVKVLKSELAATIGVDRFLREIETTARLNHPHILPLHDSGEADGFLYYVMPYMTGESLADRLGHEKQLPLDDALQIAREVCRALDYAHNQGVVHRDIKPQNILLEGGIAIVADFGIARAISEVGGAQLTSTGMAIGTPHYMSPEQGSGGTVDRRSDVYSLGCVLYELLAGEAPYTGPSAESVARQHLTAPPPSLTVMRDVPPSVDAAVRKALAKAPADRFRSAGDFAEALTAQTPVPVPDSPSTPRSRRAVQWGVPLAVVVAVLAWALTRGDEAPAPGFAGGRISRLTSFAGWEQGPSWSPDGSQIAYSHIVGGDADVATLSVGGGDPHILTGDSPADELNARWSPDGSKIAYVSDRGNGSNVYWIPPTGGAERKVAETNIPFLERMFTWAFSLGATPWSPDGEELLFSRLDPRGDVAIWKANVTTGAQRQMTNPPVGAEDGVASWSFDGTQITFMRVQNGVPSIWLLPAEGGEPTLLLGEGMDLFPAWFPGDERLAVTSFRGGAPNIWEIDIDTRTPRQITSGGEFHYSPTVASDGSIAYVQFDHQIDIHWISLGNAETTESRLTAFTGENFAPRLSPDGNRVVWYRGPPYDLWLLDQTTGQARALTTDPAADRMGDWAPNGEEIVFMSDRGGAVTLWIVNVETGVTEQLTDHELPWSMHTGDTQAGPRWSPDGQVIGYLAPADEGTAIWLVDPDGRNRRLSSIGDAFSFGWYKDGQRVMYTRRAQDGSGRVELRAAHLGTGEDVLMRVGTLSEVAVSPDGSALTYITSVSHFTMELMLERLAPTSAPNELPTTVGEPQQITFGNGEWHVHAGGWAWDGSGLVYSRDRDYGDIYIVRPLE